MENVIQFRSPVISKPMDCIPWLTDIKSRDYENFICLYIDGQNQIIKKEIIFTGNKNNCRFFSQDLFRRILNENACVAVIFAHNHPGGNVYPSDDDKRTTEVLNKGLALLGIQMLDHVIVTEDDYFSFLEHGYINK